MTIELLAIEARKAVALVRKQGDGSLCLADKIEALREAIAKIEEHRSWATHILDKINEGETTFASQAVARFQQSRFETEIADCDGRIDELSSLLREYDRRQPDLFNVPTETPTGESHTCKACGKPVYVAPIPATIGGPLGEAMCNALGGIAKHVIHAHCMERARQKSRWAFGQTS